MSVSCLGLFLTLLLVAVHVECVSEDVVEALGKVRPSLTKVPIRRGRVLHAVRNRRKSKAKVEVEGKGGCAWDAGADGCGVSHASAAEQLKKSDNAYVQFIANYAACSATKSEDACKANDKCTWAGDDGCRFIEFTVGHEDSPCVKEAEAFLKDYVAGETCSLHTTQVACIQDRKCQWEVDEEEDEHVCESAGLRFYIGVTFDELSDAAGPVIDYRVAQLVEAFGDSFDVADPDFDWAEVIEWKVPKTECPKWADDFICTYVDGVFTKIGCGFYCGAKYSDIHQIDECVEDPLCHFDLDDFACRARPEVFIPGVYKGLRDLIAKMSSASDKKILSSTLDCQAIMEEAKCTGKCVWEPESDGEDAACELRGDWIADTVAEPGKGGSDPICNLATALADSACLDIEDEDECLDNPSCVLDLEDGCTASIEYRITSALEKDADLKKSYSLLEKQCAVHKTQGACEAPTAGAAFTVF